MSDLADTFEIQIKNLEGIPGTYTTVITFKDSSRLTFDLSPNPMPQVSGLDGSTADRFASSVKLFKTMMNGFEITFSDDSKMIRHLDNVETFRSNLQN